MPEDIPNSGENLIETVKEETANRITEGKQVLSGLTSSKSKLRPAFIHIIVIIIVIILLAVAGLYLYGKYLHDNQRSSSQSNQSSSNPKSQSAALEPPLDDRKPIVKTDAIAWIAPPTIIQSLKLCNTEVNKPPNSQYGGLTDCSAVYYKVADIESGQYNGGQIILVKFKQTDPGGFTIQYFRFILQNNKLILLGKYSGDPKSVEFDTSRFATDSTYTIPEMDLPDYLYGPGKNQVLVKAQTESGLTNFFDQNMVKKVFTDRIVGDVFTTKDELAYKAPITLSESSKAPVGFDPENKPDKLRMDGFYVPKPDGTFKIYKIFINFLENNDSTFNSYKPQIAWSSGKINSNTYGIFPSAGCGNLPQAHWYAAVERDKKLSDLIVVGQTVTDDNVYSYKSDADWQNLYKDNYLILGHPMTLEEFKSTNPVFFLLDPFGRLIRFEEVSVLPLPQCDHISL